MVVKTAAEVFELHHDDDEYEITITELIDAIKASASTQAQLVTTEPLLLAIQVSTRTLSPVSFTTGLCGVTLVLAPRTQGLKSNVRTPIRL